MNIKEVLKEAIIVLEQNNIEEAICKAKLLLCFMLNKPKEHLITHDDFILENDFINKYRENINKIINGVPIQYITGYQEFMKLNFSVSPDVLIPQPDTEILVELAIDKIKPYSKVLDMCTGSGAIAISLAKYRKDIEVTATDISKQALKIAKKNAENNEVKIKFISSDMFSNINEKYDVIISNPPYIKTDVIKELSNEVKNEPFIALNGGKDGLDFYRIFAKQANRYLKPEGILMLEIGFNQAKEVCKLLDASFEDINVFKDFSQNDRVVIGVKKDIIYTFSQDLKEELKKLKVWDNKSALKQEKQLERVYVREAFLQSGYITNPEKQYHLEILFDDNEKAKSIFKILQDNGFNFRMTQRRDKYVIYIKDGEYISNFLAFIGANNSVLRFEEIRVVRQMKGDVNRKVNCETANLGKTINASIKQVEAIKYLISINEFEKLDGTLKEIAKLRLENPDMSLENLAKMLDNPVSKSGANHRLAKIIEMANEHKKKRG